VSEDPDRKIVFRPLTYVLVVLGFLFVGVAIYYFVTPAESLLSFVPGHEAGSVHHHSKHGLVMLGLAVACWIGAWFTTAPKKPAEG
jgi:hypothetical protein